MNEHPCAGGCGRKVDEDDRLCPECSEEASRLQPKRENEFAYVPPKYKPGERIRAINKLTEALVRCAEALEKES